MMLVDKIHLLRKNKSIINGSLFSLFSFINRGIGFVLLLILAKFILPTDYGYLSLFGTVTMFLGYFTAMSTEGYLSVSYFKEGEIGVKNTFSSLSVLSIITTLFGFLILIFAKSYVGELLGLPTSILYSAVLISFLTLYVNVYLDYLRIQERVVAYGVVSCSNAILNFVISIVLVYFLLWGWKGRVYAQLLCFVVFGFLSLCFFIKYHYVVIPTKEHLIKMLLWGIPLIPHQATAFFRGGCDNYIIKYFYSIEDVGLFGFANSIATVVFMLGLGFNQSNSIDIYKTLGDNNMTKEDKTHRLKKMRMLYWYLYVGFTILYIIFAFLMVPFLFPKYEESLKYMPFLAIYYFLMCIYLIYTNYLFFYNKTKDIMFITFFSAMLHLLLSLVFTRFSLYFTGIIYIFTQLIVVLVIRTKALSCLKMNL